MMGTAAIARKNWKAIRLSGNGRVSAVASRQAATAERFIDQCSDEVPMTPRPAAVEGYAELLRRDDVDAVYIPLPTAMRYEWVIAAAEAGKHVLCEKPVAVSTDHARQMIEACQRNGVQFMDGVMFSHSRRLEALRQTLGPDGACGRIRRITSHFMFHGGPEFNQSNIRVHSQLEPHGCLGDLGWYTVRFILWAMQYALPERVTARILTPLQGETSEAPVPGEFSAELFFADGVSAHFYNSFLTEHQQFARISGDRGYVTVDDFVLPYYGPELAWSSHQNVLEIDNCRWNMNPHPQRHAVAEYGGGEANAQEVHMVRRFGEIVQSGQLDPHWPEIAFKTQQVVDACLESAQHGGRFVSLT
jgi:predicted dehydrogenase